MYNIDTYLVRKFIADKYSKSELKSLCQDLNIDYEDIPDGTKGEIIMELVEYCKRKDSLSDLVNILKRSHGQEVHFFKKSPSTDFSDSSKQARYIPEQPVISEKLEKLRRFLEKEQWREADKQTLEIVLFLAEAEKRGILGEQGCKNLFDKASQEVLQIDKLWMSYSGGRFGFSVQKSIFLTVSEDLNRFCILVGWRKPPGRFGGLFSWKTYDELTFNIEAERGHLPFLAYKDINASTIASRLGAVSDFLLVC